MTYYPIGTLVQHRHFSTRTLGIVKAVEIDKWMVIEWFSSLEETMEEMWEVISIEEIDNDE